MNTKRKARVVSCTLDVKCLGRLICREPTHALVLKAEGFNELSETPTPYYGPCHDLSFHDFVRPLAKKRWSASHFKKQSYTTLREGQCDLSRRVRIFGDASTFMVVHQACSTAAPNHLFFVLSHRCPCRPWWLRKSVQHNLPKYPWTSSSSATYASPNTNHRVSILLSSQ